MARRKSITIKDIARESGVSPTTVSRILSDNGYPVSEHLHKKVMQIAQQLSYIPSSSSHNRKTIYNEVAILVPSILNPFYTSLVTGFESMLAQSEHTIFIYNTSANFNHSNAERILDSAISKGVVGIVVADANMHLILEARKKKLENQNIKIVLVDCPSNNNEYNTIYFDYEKGSKMGTEYLLGKGHHNIVYAGLELERESRIRRVEGYKKALLSNGFSCDDKSVFIYEDDKNRECNQVDAGEILAKRILAMEKLPTAIVAVNDMVAFGILRCLSREHINVPQDISVLGFDDSQFSEMSSPTLTTVKVHAEQMGRMAGMLLLGSMSNSSLQAIGLNLEPCIIERDSVRDIR